jgi:hypothetical protein
VGGGVLVYVRQWNRCTLCIQKSLVVDISVVEPELFALAEPECILDPVTDLVPDRHQME